MKVAIILMTILGCDDAGVQCTPIASPSARWTTIASCDAASQKELQTYSAQKFPMIVAVCQTAEPDPQAAINKSEPKPPSIEEKPSLAARAIALVTQALPSADGLKNIVKEPVYIVADTYSWVARRIRN